MKRTLVIVGVLFSCELAGYVLTTVNPQARHVARRGYVWLWHHGPHHGYRMPDRFLSEDEKPPFIVLDPNAAPK